MPLVMISSSDIVPELGSRLVSAMAAALIEIEKESPSHIFLDREQYIGKEMARGGTRGSDAGGAHDQP